MQEEGRQLLQRAEPAECQVCHLQDDNHSLFTQLADAQQQLPALQSQLQVRDWIWTCMLFHILSSAGLVHMNESACRDQAGCRLTSHWLFWQLHLIRCSMELCVTL